MGRENAEGDFFLFAEGSLVEAWRRRALSRDLLNRGHIFANFSNGTERHRTGLLPARRGLCVRSADAAGRKVQKWINLALIHIRATL